MELLECEKEEFRSFLLFGEAGSISTPFNSFSFLKSVRLEDCSRVCLLGIGAFDADSAFCLDLNFGLGAVTDLFGATGAAGIA